MNAEPPAKTDDREEGRPPRRRHRRRRRRRREEGTRRDEGRREEGTRPSAATTTPAPVVAPAPIAEPGDPTGAPAAAARPRRGPEETGHAAPSGQTREVSGDDLRAVVEGWSHDPHGVLGTHLTARRLGRAHAAARRGLGGRPRRGRRPLRGAPAARRRHLRGPPAEAARRLPHRGRLRRRRGRHQHLHRRRPLPLDADARRARPAPDPGGPARAAVGRARRARPALRDPARHRRGRLVRRVGPERPRREGHRRLRLLGGPRLPDAVAGLLRRLGDLHPRRPGRQPVPLPRARRRRHLAGEVRPAGLRHRGPAAQRLGRHRVDLRVGRRRLARRAGRAPAGTSAR